MSYQPSSFATASLEILFFFLPLYTSLFFSFPFEWSELQFDVIFYQDRKDPPGCQNPSGSTLGVELCKVHRRFSGNLQLPPLSWRQAEKERERESLVSPVEDPVTQARPTSLPIASLPRIDITKAEPNR